MYIYHGFKVAPIFRVLKRSTELKLSYTLQSVVLTLHVPCSGTYSLGSSLLRYKNTTLADGRMILSLPL